jgi:hypothetical protein
MALQKALVIKDGNVQQLSTNDQLSLHAGTSVLPSLSFEDAGIYSPDTGELAIATEGAQRISVTSTGFTVGDYTLPLTDGSDGQFLRTDGQGELYWQDKAIEVSYAAVAVNASSDSSTFELVGGFSLDASDYSEVRFKTLASVTDSGLTGEIQLYNLTDNAPVVTHTYTSTTPSEVLSSPLTLPASAKVYEVRHRVTGGTPPGDRVVTSWAGFKFAS